MEKDSIFNDMTKEEAKEHLKKRAYNVKELIEHLNQFNPELPVLIIQEENYGNGLPYFMEFDLDDINQRTVSFWDISDTNLSTDEYIYQHASKTELAGDIQRRLCEKHKLKTNIKSIQNVIKHHKEYLNNDVVSLFTLSMNNYEKELQKLNDELQIFIKEKELSFEALTIGGLYA